ncbi:MAG: hypothetical protein V4473_00030 [Patescibacteria group bacterium]
MSNNKNQTSKRFPWIKGLIIAGVIIIIFIGYIAGYRLSRTLAIGKIGSIEMTLPLNETSVLVDNKEKLLTSEENQKVNISVTPGEHKIIIARKSYFPWTQNIVMPSDGHMNFTPIFVSQNTSGMIVGTRDPEYWQIKKEIETATLPTLEKPLVSRDGTVTVWIENNAIIARTHGEVHTVIQPTAPVKNIAFYKDRSDTLVFSVMNAVSVIEIETDGIQNFMPIYKGTDPHFIAPDPTFLYVEDGNTLLQVSI